MLRNLVMLVSDCWRESTKNTHSKSSFREFSKPNTSKHWLCNLTNRKEKWRQLLVMRRWKSCICRSASRKRRLAMRWRMSCWRKRCTRLPAQLAFWKVGAFFHFFHTPIFCYHDLFIYLFSYNSNIFVFVVCLFVLIYLFNLFVKTKKVAMKKSANFCTTWRAMRPASRTMQRCRWSLDTSLLAKSIKFAFKLQRNSQSLPDNEVLFVSFFFSWRSFFYIFYNLFIYYLLLSFSFCFDCRWVFFLELCIYLCL